MSLLTGILRVLARLATISGCNIYRFVPHSCKFERQPRLQLLVTLLHCFWLRPWLFLSCYLHIRWFMLNMLFIVSGNVDRDNSLPALLEVYFLSQLVMKYQNIFATISIAYIYKYHQPQIERMLNEFVAIYERFYRRYGHAPQINWWLFGVYMSEFVSLSRNIVPFSDFSHVPYWDSASSINAFMGWSTVLFVALQPFLLGLLAHLGLLLLQGYYVEALQQLRTDRGRLTAAVYKKRLEHYLSLMQLRQHFELLLRPFVFVAMLAELNICMLCFHLLMFDMQRMGYFFYSIAINMIYPLCFAYQSHFFKSAERQFGHHLLRFKHNGNRQQQLQIFCLQKLIMSSAWERGKFNVFKLNRGHVLECLYFSWVMAMFTNSVLVNSPQAWLKHNLQPKAQ